ncbi:hypothetical protein T484DRAFT_1877750, partial [Baffinella frigidus]
GARRGWRARGARSRPSCRAPASRSRWPRARSSWQRSPAPPAHSAACPGRPAPPASRRFLVRTRARGAASFP